MSEVHTFTNVAVNFTGQRTDEILIECHGESEILIKFFIGKTKL